MESVKAITCPPRSRGQGRRPGQQHSRSCLTQTQAQDLTLAMLLPLCQRASEQATHSSDFCHCGWLVAPTSVEDCFLGPHPHLATVIPSGPATTDLIPGVPPATQATGYRGRGASGGGCRPDPPGRPGRKCPCGCRTRKSWLAGCHHRHQPDVLRILARRVGVGVAPASPLHAILPAACV